MASQHDDHTGLRAPGFAGATGWLNGRPLDPPNWPAGPTLVDFFTFSCVNCVRTLPHLRAWHARYAGLGLRVVGVHTPEFDFEREPDAVAHFLADHDLAYPVALDADRRIWDRWANKFWPRKYLVDRAGRIRYDRIGEGGYADTEAAIQRLLREAAPDLALPPVEAPVDDVPFGAVCVRPTVELFAGWYRGLSGHPGGWVEDRPAAYTPPAEPRDGALTLSGRWRVGADASEALAPEPGDGETWAGVRFFGYEANAVLRSADGEPIRVAVTLDGRPVATSDAGTDVRTEGGAAWCEVGAGRLYRLIAAAGYGPQTLRLYPERPGLLSYSFTFGGCPVER